MTSDIWTTATADEFPWLTTAQMAEVDRIMIEDLQIELKQMMENAGRNLAALAIGLYSPASAVVLAGRGGNGGGGLVAARHLANHGVDVTVAVSRPPEEFLGVPAHQLEILQRMGVSVIHQDRFRSGQVDVVVDAVIGYSLRGAPRGVGLALIEAANLADAPKVSLDVPSGIDSTTGDSPGVSVRADATLTLAAPKIGLRAVDTLGRLFVGDISVPPSVYATLGVDRAPNFAGHWIVELPST